MAFSVVTNVGALSAKSQLGTTQAGLQKTLGRLSTGLRINSAGDDAAGLAIADGLRADVGALNQAVRNANDGLGIINVADSAMGEISNLLQRAVTLAEQASSDTSGADSSTSKTALDDEYQAILSEIDRITDTVEFNGVKLIDGTGTTVDIQVGLDGGANSTLSIGTTGVDSTALSLSGSLTTAAGAKTELDAIKTAIDDVSAARGNLGAVANRLDRTISVITSQAENLKAAESQIRDADIASEVVNLTKFQVLNQTGISALAQANVSSQSVLSLLG